MTYVYGAVAALVLILMGGWWYSAHEAQTAREALTAYISKSAQLVADQMKADQAKAQAAEDHNAVLISILNGQLSDSIADGTRLAVQLRNALAWNGGRPVPKAPDQPGAAPAPGDSVIDRAAQLVGDVTAECERNDDHLSALIQELKPQL